MPERRLVICTECETPTVGRVWPDGDVVVPTDDGACPCGAETFEPFEG